MWKVEVLLEGCNKVQCFEFVREAWEFLFTANLGLKECGIFATCNEMFSFVFVMKVVSV